jgi:putative SOS response-associated peptidase YedK
MCNLYSLNKGQDHIGREFRVHWDDTGNMPPLPGIFPEMLAPVVRNDGDGRRMQMMRWGMPTPPKFLTAGAIDRGVTNIRNVNSAHWRAWLKPEFRCLVPATSFSEPTDAPNPATGKKDWKWFAISEKRPLFAFAGIWCPWNGTRGTKKNPVEGRHLLYGILTTEPNAVVKPVHSKAMPVILTGEARDVWLRAPVEEALALQKPAPDDLLRIVEGGDKTGDPSQAQVTEEPRLLI